MEGSRSPQPPVERPATTAEPSTATEEPKSAAVAFASSIAQLVSPAVMRAMEMNQAIVIQNLSESCAMMEQCTDLSGKAIQEFAVEFQRYTRLAKELFEDLEHLTIGVRALQKRFLQHYPDYDLKIEKIDLEEVE